MRKHQSNNLMWAPMHRSILYYTVHVYNVHLYLQWVTCNSDSHPECISPVCPISDRNSPRGATHFWWSTLDKNKRPPPQTQPQTQPQPAVGRIDRRPPARLILIHNARQSAIALIANVAEALKTRARRAEATGWELSWEEMGQDRTGRDETGWDEIE